MAEEVTLKLTLNDIQFLKALKQASQQTVKNTQALKGMANQAAKVGKQFSKTAEQTERNTKGLRGLSTSSVNLAAKLSILTTAFSVFSRVVRTAFNQIEDVVLTAAAFETAFTGVIKVVDGTSDQIKLLERNIITLSREIPVTAIELSKIAEAAGRLGVPIANIETFTETIAKLGVATELTSEQAAIQFARLANITQLPLDQVDKLGSAIVDLGNNFATSEPEILTFALRIAAAGNQIGISTEQTLAFGAALTSVGVEAEAGGTAISKVFFSINNAVRGGGEELERFADVAGVSIDEFAKVFREDAAQAVVLFIEGLNRLNKEGKNLSPILEDLSFKDVRLTRTLLSAAGAGDLLRNALERSSRAFEQNSALTKEANTRFQTFDSQLQLLINNFDALTVVIGSEFLPVLNEAFTQITENLAPTIAWAQANSDVVSEEILSGFKIFLDLLTALVKVTAVIADAFRFVVNVIQAVIGSLISFGAVAGKVFTFLPNAVFGVAEEFRNLADEADILGEELTDSAVEGIKSFDKFTERADSLNDRINSLTNSLEGFKKKTEEIASNQATTSLGLILPGSEGFTGKQQEGAPEGKDRVAIEKEFTVNFLDELEKRRDALKKDLALRTSDAFAQSQDLLNLRTMAIDQEIAISKIGESELLSLKLQARQEFTDKVTELIGLENQTETEKAQEAFDAKQRLLEQAFNAEVISKQRLFEFTVLNQQALNEKLLEIEVAEDERKKVKMLEQEEARKEDFEKRLDELGIFAESAAEAFDVTGDVIGDITKTIGGTLVQTFQQVESAVAKAFTAMIVGGKSAKEIFKELGVSIVATLVQGLVRVGVQALLNAVFAQTAAQAEITAASAKGGANAIASMAGAPFPINLTAPAFGAFIKGLINAQRSFQAGSDFVSSTGPAFIHQGERIIPAQTNVDLTRFLRNQADGPSGGPQGNSIIINVDTFIGDEEFADEMARKVSDSIDLNGIEFRG